MKIGLNFLFLVAGKGGGIERFSRNLVRSLARIDRENEYIIFTNKNCSGTFDIGNNFKEVACRVSATFRPAKTFWEQFILPWQLKKHHIDVLLSLGNTSPAIHTCPSVTFIYDMIPYARPEAFNWFELFILKTLFRASAARSSRIITISISSKNEITGRFHVRDDKIRIVYGACEPGFSPAGKMRRAHLAKYGIVGNFILSVASSRPYKNIDGLIRAFKLLKDRHNVDHTLVITGLAGKAQPSLAQLIRELALHKGVLFSGFVHEEDLPILYASADVFVYPSFYEGFGLPVLEAMACGTPVAASNAAALPEAVGDAGLLFDPYSVKGMADAIYTIIENGDLRKTLVKKGLERAKQFSWEKTALEVLEILRSTSVRPKEHI